MGARGPKREPAEIKAAKGTRQPHRDPAPVAQNYGIPPNPFDADHAPDEHAAHEWITGKMLATGTHIVLTPADFGALQAAAIALARAMQASKEVLNIPIDKRMVHTASNGLMSHPWLREEKAAWKEWRAFASDLGLSPTARNNVTAAKAGGATPSDDDPLLGRLLTLVPQPVDDEPASAKRRAPAKPASKPRAKAAAKPKAATTRRPR